MSVMQPESGRRGYLDDLDLDKELPPIPEGGHRDGRGAPVVDANGYRIGKVVWQDDEGFTVLLNVVPGEVVS